MIINITQSSFILGMAISTLLLIVRLPSSYSKKILKDKTLSMLFTVLPLIFYIISLFSSDMVGIYFIIFIIFTHLFLLLILLEVGFFKINELILLSFTLTFWYSFIGKTKIALQIFLSLLGVLPTIILIFLLFTKSKLSNFLKTILYLWFLFVDVYLILFNFSQIGLPPLFFIEMEAQASFSNSFFAGMVFPYLSFNILFLLFINELKIKTHSFFNKTTKLLYSFLLLFFQGGIYLLNYFFQIIPDYLLINIFIFLTPYLFLRPEKRA